MEIQLKENLKKLLDARGMKAAELARISGVAPSVISEWMSGRHPRNVLNLQKIAEHLGVSLGELCFEKWEPGQGRKNTEGLQSATSTKEVFPLILPIDGSGVLEFQVRWTQLKEEKQK
jgi:transcriptional regulator with XRE-family HTH domain